MSFVNVREELLSLYGNVRSPATAEEIDASQDRLSVQMPIAVRAAYLLMDGADHSTSPESSWMRFWAIHEWVSAKEMLPSDVSKEEEGRLFVFADYGIESVHYAMDLQPKSKAFGRVYALGATRVAEVAQSFSEFVELVLADSNALHTYS